MMKVNMSSGYVQGVAFDPLACKARALLLSQLVKCSHIYTADAGSDVC